MEFLNLEEQKSYRRALFLKERNMEEKPIPKGGSPKVYFGLPKHLGGRERTRYIVRRRDNYSCQNCGEVRLPKECGKGKKFKKSLDVHHLFGLCGKKSRLYDKTSEINNLITLCHRCHYNHPEHSRLNNLLVK